MSAQEFSSPGEHMASMSSSPDVNGGSVFRNPNRQNWDSDNIVVGQPPIDYGYINNSYNNYREERGEFGGSAHSFNRYYMDYNDSLFNSAKDYDMYMSNTAIQRQVEDLKKAGLNPILAAHLGGATYKGVNAPYIAISPGSALQAYTNYDSSMYATDTYNMTNKEIAQLQTSSSEFIAQFNKTMERIINGDNITAGKELVKLKRDADEYLENIMHSNKMTLQTAGFAQDAEVYAIKKEVDKDYYNFVNGLDKYDNFDHLMDRLSRLLPGAQGLLHN